MVLVAKWAVSGTRRQGQRVLATRRGELRGASKEQMGTVVSVHCTTTGGSSPPFTELHWQGGLHTEDTVPGWDDAGGIRARGFHRSAGGARA